MNQPVARFARITEFARGGLGIYDIQRVAPAGLEAEAETQAGGGEHAGEQAVLRPHGLVPTGEVLIARLGAAHVAL
jgi:hypothetical protein